MEPIELQIRSTMDGTLQPSLFYPSPSREKRPLLVGLHTWSYDRFNQVKRLVPFAQKLDWNLILPEFRGSNLTKNPHCRDACGAELAKRDIQDAVEYLVREEKVDAENVFLIGYSGGGHMALLMAAQCPRLFRAVTAGVPITDLEAWAEENERYRKHVLACCGEDREEMKKRSPIHYLEGLSRANVKIFHGKKDPVVPVAQSLRLFGAMMERYPEASFYLDIFDGGHEMDLQSAEHWILTQWQEKVNLAVSG